MVLEYLAYPFKPSPHMQKDKARRVKNLVLLVWAIMLFGRNHHIEPSKLRFVSIESSTHNVGTFGYQKKILGCPNVNLLPSRPTSDLLGALVPQWPWFYFRTRLVEKNGHVNRNASVGSINVRNNIGPQSQGEIFLVTELRHPLSSSTTPTPARTIALSSTTTCTTIRSSSASPPSSEKIPISRITPPPQTITSSATIAASINSNIAIQTPIGRLYLPHLWNINQGNHVGIGEISQTISISGDEQDDFSLDDQNTNSEWDRSLRHVAEGDLVATGNSIWSQEDGPTLVGYLGDLVNDIPLNDFDVFPLVTNGNPFMMNGIGSNHGGASTTEASDRDLMHGGSNYVELSNPGEIYDNQRTRTWEWLERNLSFPLGPEGRAQRLSNIAMQVALIDDILYISNDEHIEDGDEEKI